MIAYYILMEDSSLKGKPEFYDASSRTRFIQAVEYAGEKMVAGLRSYVGLYNKGPAEIVIRVNEKSEYSPCLPEARVYREVKRLELSSRVFYSLNGASGELVFDLDALADEYFALGLDGVLGRKQEDDDLK